MNEFMKRVAAKLPFSFPKKKEKTEDQRRVEYIQSVEEAKKLLGITPEIMDIITKIKYHGDAEEALIRYLGLNRDDFDFIRGLSTKNLDIGWMEANEYYRANRAQWRKFYMKDSLYILSKMNLLVREITQPEKEENVMKYAFLIFLASVLIKRINVILPTQQVADQPEIS